MKQLSVFMLALLLVTGCGKNDATINFKDDYKNEVVKKYTYKFVGESKHFYFETGKVYYNDDDRSLFISNFKYKDNVNKNAKISINLYFNNNILYGDISNNSLSDIEELKNVVISEYGSLKKDENGNIIGESDSFLETTKDIFKDSIKLVIKYCIKDGCNNEEFKIKYLE